MERREYAVQAAILLLATALATAGCRSAGIGASPEASSNRSVTVGPTSVTAIECGQTFRPPAGGGLAMTWQFPTSAPPGEMTVAGTVEVTSQVAVLGVVPPQADVFLVQDGRVATLPKPQDAVGIRWNLVPGTTKLLPGEATLISCKPGGGSVSPGTYELYARLVLIPDDGAIMECVGGPWPLEVR